MSKGSKDQGREGLLTDDVQAKKLPHGARCVRAGSMPQTTAVTLSHMVAISHPISSYALQRVLCHGRLQLSLCFSLRSLAYQGLGACCVGSCFCAARAPHAARWRGAPVSQASGVSCESCERRISTAPRSLSLQFTRLTLDASQLSSRPCPLY